MRAQLIEFTAPMRCRALNAASAFTCFTTSWQSSNVPSTARLWMFGSRSEYICAAWNALMRPCGESMKTCTPRRPRSACSAAEPVSPEVAPSTFSVCRRRTSTSSKRAPSSCNAMSLNASVGPFDSPSRCRPGSSVFSGAMSSLPNTSRV